MTLRTFLMTAALALTATACRTTPLDNVWPGCATCCPPAPTPTVSPTVQQAPPPAPQGRVPVRVEIDERVSPVVDCNPVRTQHTLVATVYDQFDQPMPGQRVDWILSRFGGAVGDIVAHDDQYGQGAIAPIGRAFVGNNGNKITNDYAISVTNYGPELLDAGNNYPYEGANGARLPDIQINEGQSWVTITSTRGGVTDIVCFVPAIRDGTKHKIFAKKVWADFEVEFPEDAVNTLPDATHDFPVRVSTRSGDPLDGQMVTAEILDGPDAVFESGGGTTAELRAGANGIANFRLRNRSGQSGANRVRFTVKGKFFDEICPRSRIVTKTWRKVSLGVNCAFSETEAVVGREITKTITVTNTGDAAAENVVVQDTPGAGLQQVGGERFPFTIGTLAAGESRNVTATFTANRSGRYENRVSVESATGNARAESTCGLEFVQGELEITKVCEPARANAGSDVRFVVTVTNSGRGPLENVQVVDRYPQGIRPTSRNNATIPLIPAGESREVIFTGVATEPGAFTNFAAASAEGIPEKEASCTLDVVECSLQMEIKGPENIYYGEEANFTLRVVNVGDGPAEGCTVRVQFGGCLGGGFEDFNVGPLGPKQDWTTTFSKVASSVGPCIVEANSTCGARCSVRQDAAIRVTGLTALQTEMIDRRVDGTEEGIFRVGDTFIYTLTVENDAGTDATPPLKVTWEMPPELEFVSGRCLNGEVNVTGSGQSAASGEFSLDVGGVLNFEIQVRVRGAPPSSLIRTEALILRASDGVVLADETESTTLRK